MSEVLSSRGWRATVFSEQGFAGNRALVHLGGSAPAPADANAVAARPDASAGCFSWPVADGFGVQCYSRGGRIRCCGHGMLAAAAVLVEMGNDAPIRFTLGAAADPVVVWQDESLFWLSLSRLRCRSVAVPHWTARAFSQPAAGAALAAGEDGYLVLEFDPAWPLAQLQVDLAVICASTRRAVIATQPMESGPYDFCLRYFAPQYGVPEDAVTGSASRVLADYWNQRLGHNAYCAWQCSVAGGVVHLQLKQTRVEVGGTVTLVRED